MYRLGVSVKLDTEALWWVMSMTRDVGLYAAVKSVFSLFRIVAVPAIEKVGPTYALPFSFCPYLGPYHTA